MANTDILNWSGVQTLWNKIKATFIGRDQIATTMGASDTRPISQRAVTEAIDSIKTKIVDTQYLGKYMAGEVYPWGGVVEYNGSSWVCIVTSSASVPSEDNPEWQLMAEKGGKGDKGDKGDAFTYDDLTPSQKAELKGEKGDAGKDLTYDDLTDEQKAELKGEKGDTGDTLQFDDLTDAQKALLKGEKGDTVVVGNGQTYTLYNSKGSNTNGAMSQKAVTDELNKLIVRVTPDEYDAMLEAGLIVKGTYYALVEEE